MTFTIYKKLFEIRILHNFYLDNRGGVGTVEEFHTLPPDEQAHLLNNGYDISKDIDVLPSERTVELMKRLRMRLVKTTSGFFAGMEVKLHLGERLKPKFNVPDGSRFTFFLKARNPFWHSMTNHAMKYPLPAKYLLTNRRETGDGKAAPSLSRKEPVFDSVRTWEMGELVNDGNELKFVLKTDPAGSSDFSLPIAGNNYANINDRIALPKYFQYRFDPKVGPVTKAEFILKAMNGDEVKKIVKIYDPVEAPPLACTLDFRFQEIPAGETKAPPIADGYYTQGININNAPFGSSQKIKLYDELANDQSVFAVVEMVHEAGLLGGFHLLEPDGAVRAVKIPGTPNRWRNESVFDIRLASRPTYWLYHVQSNNGHTAGDVVQHPDAGHLVTTGARAVTRAAQVVNYGPNQTQFLPSPSNLHLNYDPVGGRFLSEIFISLPDN